MGNLVYFTSVVIMIIVIDENKTIAAHFTRTGPLYPPGLTVFPMLSPQR